MLSTLIGQGPEYFCFRQQRSPNTVCTYHTSKRNFLSFYPVLSTDLLENGRVLEINGRSAVGQNSPAPLVAVARVGIFVVVYCWMISLPREPDENAQVRTLAGKVMKHFLDPCGISHGMYQHSP